MSSFRDLRGIVPAIALTAALACAGCERTTKTAAGWTADVQTAMKQAGAEKKDLLLDFTGSDWCIWCQRLATEVFNTEEFRKEAPKSFVLVELDFPNDGSKLSAQTKKQNQEWSERLGVQGFPTIFLADEQGLPYAKTGYKPGGAQKYLAHLAELRNVRARRDEALAKAKAATGAEKARLLDAALEVVGAPLLPAYAEQVKEILALDAENAAGLKSKYEGKLKLAR